MSTASTCFARCSLDPTSVTRPRRLQGKTVWEHSPTQRKIFEITRLNRGAQLPINCVTAPPISPGSHYSRGPSTYQPPTCHVAPHTGARVTRPCGLLPRVSATCASRGPLGLYHVASVPRRTSRRSRAPRQLPLATSPCR